MNNELNRSVVGLAEQQGFTVRDGTYSREIRGVRYDFRRVTDIDDLEATTPLQKSVFFKNDPDYYTCPGHMLATLNKLGGIVISGYNAESQLVSFSYNWPMIKDGRSDLLLLDMIGVSEDLQDKGIGFEAMKVLLVEASQKNITEIQFTFDPLKMRNANIYLTKIGARVIDFEEDPYGKEGLSGDRFLASWDISNPEVALDRMSGRTNSQTTIADMHNYPMVTQDYFPNEDHVLLPAPENDALLTLEERVLWGTLYRNVGRAYFPEYNATEFISDFLNGSRVNRYILSKDNK